MSTPRTSFLVFFVLISARVSQTTTTEATATCTACRCYKVKCSRIENADIDCDDDYKPTCDHSSEIVEEKNCQLQCDCCLEGQCYKWSSYNCLIFRTFEFFSVIYFLAISANFFLVWQLFKNFFRLKRSYDKAHFSEPTKNNRNYYKYVQSLWIRRYREVTKMVIPDKKSRDIAALFVRVENLKPFVFRNLVFFLSVVSIYLVLTGVNLFVLFFLLEKPFIYGVAAWVQHVFHAIFYVTTLAFGFRMKSYRGKVNEVIDAFEVENSCKVRIINKLQLIEINWAPRLFEAKLSDTKQVVKLMKKDIDKDDASEMDNEVIRVKKIDIKEGKAKKFTAKVTPL